MEVLLDLLKKNKKLFKRVLNIINKMKKITYKVVGKVLPVQDNVILFCSHKGKDFSCNPKALYNEIKSDERFKDFRLVWAFKDIHKNKLEGVINIEYNSMQYYYYLSIAKYWIFNAKMPSFYSKKKSQIYLQTWHGTPLKKLASDIEIGKDAEFYRSNINKAEMTKTYTIDSSKYDYMISANQFSTKAFASAFHIRNSIMIETGYPRNDILVNSNGEHIRHLKGRYGIAEGKTVILYAPTWRDNHYDNKGYIFELKVDFDRWYESLGDNYVVIYKPHYLIHNTTNKKLRDGFVYDASQCEDINDLYLMSDLLITDYSSVFFDYGVLKRPVLFYMYDVEDYRDNLRGFYLDIYSDLPGPILEDEGDVLDKILHIEEVVEEYEGRMELFYDEFCYLSDGNSSKKVIDIVFKK